MRNMSPRLSTFILAFLSIGSALASDSEPPERLVQVAANGVDEFPCGGESNPCRSITFGIQNANPGDTVLVGPGKYGDLNNDGFLNEPGEEGGEIGFGCQCMVRVYKGVRIVSSHDAAVTVLDSSAMATPTITVFITANDVQFGLLNHGFLLRAPSNYTGVYVFASTGVTVAGNIATGAANGISTDGGSDNVIEHNIANGNIVGFELGGTNLIARSNHASGNVLGFIVYGTHTTLTKNIASANSDSGFVIAGSPGVVLSRNLTTGNLHGFRVETGTTPRIVRNNIYGNQNCGIFNRSDATIDATRNYWGAPSGPGPDPADIVCDQEADDITLTSPVLKHSVRVPPMRSKKHR